MFLCPLCGRVVARRVPACRVVVKTRPKTYPLRHAANRPVARIENGRKRSRRPDDPGGTGRETVQEILACAACAAAAARRPGKP
jgi:hypothetical protein